MKKKILAKNHGIINLLVYFFISKDNSVVKKLLSSIKNPEIARKRGM